MTKDFIKKNWIYIALLSLIILINVLPRFMEREAPLKEVKVEEEGLFVDFEEAQERSKKIENILQGNRPLYLFYMSLNLAIVFLFLLGLTVDGYFLFKRSKKRKIFQKSDASPPPWRIEEIFKIIILGFSVSYIFFIAFGRFIGTDQNFRMIFDTIILDGAVFLVILGFLWHVHKKALASLGFTKKNMGRNIFYGIAGYIGVMPIIFVIGILVYILLNLLKLKPPPQPIVGFFLAEENIALIFVSSLIASILGPVIEEIFFRGVMYNAVKRKLGIFWGILITSVLFSFLHTHAASYFLVGFVPIMILGAALAYLYEKTGSLIPSITLHVLNNVGSVIMVFTFRYFNNLVK